MYWTLLNVFRLIFGPCWAPLGPGGAGNRFPDPSALRLTDCNQRHALGTHFVAISRSCKKVARPLHPVGKATLALPDDKTRVSRRFGGSEKLSWHDSPCQLEGAWQEAAETVRTAPEDKETTNETTEETTEREVTGKTHWHKDKEKPQQQAREGGGSSINMKLNGSVLLLFESDGTCHSSRSEAGA